MKSSAPQTTNHNLSRRGFSKLLSLAPLFAIGSVGMAATRRLLSSAKIAAQPMTVATVGELKVGEYKLFRYPTENDPCILIRLAPDRHVAFSQCCTHLKCPVHFQPSKKQLVCPCHEGFFGAEDGRPLAGPPKTALTQFAVEIKGAEIRIRERVA